MTKFHEISRQAIRTIIPYEPGKPISEVQREYGISDVIKLASNENPLGPSPKAMEAIKLALPDLHIYPDGGCYNLKQKISQKFDAPVTQIVVGNGSAEIVELITEAFVDEGDEVVIGREEFFKYRIAVQIMNGKVVWTPMPNLEYDVDEILSRINEHTKLVFIANPNNPTGTLMNRERVEEYMARVPEHVITVFDEAYYEFRTPEKYPDTMQYVRDNRNVVVMRTMSKIYGLAALRIGYAFAPDSICYAMNAVREAFNVNSLAQVAATAALDDEEHLLETLRINSEGKTLFYTELDRLGLEYLKTEANFVLIKLPMLGRDLFKLMLKRGVVIRPVDNYNLPYYVRVSIGLPDQNRRFFKEFEDILKTAPKSFI